MKTQKGRNIENVEAIVKHGTDNIGEVSPSVIKYIRYILKLKRAVKEGKISTREFDALLNDFDLYCRRVN